MKKLITILLLAFIIVGCKKDIGTPESAAEKYLSDLSSDLSELGFYSSVNHDNRSLALMLNEQADSIISGGKIPAMSELFDKYFQDDKLFHRWELMEKGNDTIDIYKVFDLTNETDATMLDAYLSMESYASKKIIRTEKAATFRDFENIPIYKLKYKIDPVHIDFEGDKYKVAEVGVIKHPEDGYKIVSFIWE